MRIPHPSSRHPRTLSGRQLATRTVGVAALSAALALPASVAHAAAPTTHKPTSTTHKPAAPTAKAPAATAPTLSALARAHGVDAAHGAVPGWTTRHLRANAVTAPVPVSAARISGTMLKTTSTQVSGIDVSAWSGTVNWPAFKAMGVRFAYVKVSEGNYYLNGLSARQIAGARAAGVLVGGYHFANPTRSSGAAQADYFVAHGGGWTPGSMPGVLDIEWNPYQGNMCYGLSQAQMTAWITSFQREYLRKAGTWPTIYTATSWWNRCVGNSVGSAVVAARSDLWLSTLTTTLGALPYNWTWHRIWQYGEVAAGNYDLNLFNGSTTMLQAMALAGE